MHSLNFNIYLLPYQDKLELYSSNSDISGLLMELLNCYSLGCEYRTRLLMDPFKNAHVFYRDVEDDLVSLYNEPGEIQMFTFNMNRFPSHKVAEIFLIERGTDFVNAEDYIMRMTKHTKVIQQKKKVGIGCFGVNNNDQATPCFSQETVNYTTQSPYISPSWFERYMTQNGCSGANINDQAAPFVRQESVNYISQSFDTPPLWFQQYMAQFKIEIMAEFEDMMNKHFNQMKKSAEKVNAEHDASIVKQPLQKRVPQPIKQTELLITNEISKKSDVLGSDIISGPVRKCPWMICDNFRKSCGLIEDPLEYCNAWLAFNKNNSALEKDAGLIILRHGNLYMRMKPHEHREEIYSLITFGKYTGKQVDINLAFASSGIRVIIQQINWRFHPRFKVTEFSVKVQASDKCGLFDIHFKLTHWNAVTCFTGCNAVCGSFKIALEVQPDVSNVIVASPVSEGYMKEQSRNVVTDKPAKLNSGSCSSQISNNDTAFVSSGLAPDLQNVSSQSYMKEQSRNVVTDKPAKLNSGSCSSQISNNDTAFVSSGLAPDLQNVSSQSYMEEQSRNVVTDKPAEFNSGSCLSQNKDSVSNNDTAFVSSGLASDLQNVSSQSKKSDGDTDNESDDFYKISDVQISPARSLDGWEELDCKFGQYDMSKSSSEEEIKTVKPNESTQKENVRKIEDKHLPKSSSKQKMKSGNFNTESSFSQFPYETLHMLPESITKTADRITKSVQENLSISQDVLNTMMTNMGNGSEIFSSHNVANIAATYPETLFGIEKMKIPPVMGNLNSWFSRNNCNDNNSRGSSNNNNNNNHNSNSNNNNNNNNNGSGRSNNNNNNSYSGGGRENDNNYNVDGNDIFRYTSRSRQPCRGLVARPRCFGAECSNNNNNNNNHNSNSNNNNNNNNNGSGRSNNNNNNSYRDGGRENDNNYNVDGNDMTSCSRQPCRGLVARPRCCRGLVARPRCFGAECN